MIALPKLSDALLFRLALMGWRGVQTLTPLVFTQLFSDRQFNTFAATLGTVQLAAGIVGFGQTQYVYALLHESRGKGHDAGRFDVQAIGIATLAALACFALLDHLPGNARPEGLLPRLGLVLAAVGMFLVDLAATQHLLAGDHRRAVRVYLLAAAAFVASTVPVVVAGDARQLAWGGLAGGAALAHAWTHTERLAATRARLRDRLVFGGTQTAILLFSGAVPLLLHLLLPQWGLDLKGSKYISIFTAIAGIAMFFGATGMVARSAEIASQSAESSRHGVNAFIRQAALRYLPVVAVALLVEHLMLGAVSPLVAVCCWVFLVSQLTVAYSRYLAFAHKALRWDLAANVLPLAVVAGALWLAHVTGALALGPQVPVVLLTLMALVSAAIYWTAICTGRLGSAKRAG